MDLITSSEKCLGVWRVDWEDNVEGTPNVSLEGTGRGIHWLVGSNRSCRPQGSYTLKSQNFSPVRVRLVLLNQWDVGNQF